MRKKLIIGIWVIATIIMCIGCGFKEEETTKDMVVVELCCEDPDEDMKIIEALKEQGYYRDDIPLTYSEQAFLHAACDEFPIDGIDNYALALSIIWRETNFENIACEKEQSYGYMMINSHWAQAEIEKLGITDLMNPMDNFRVGMCILQEHIANLGFEAGVARYNGSGANARAYAVDILNKYNEYCDLLKET